MTLRRRESIDAPAAWNWFRRKLAIRVARCGTKRRIGQTAVQRLLVVCHGNIYRSPFAAALLAKELDPDVTVRSAGFHPDAGRRAPPVHIAMSRPFGVHLEEHVSGTVDAGMVQWADSIVLMDSYNWLSLMDLGVASHKLIWLGSFDDGPVEIPDPRDLPQPSAELVLGRIANCVHALAKQLPRPAARSR